MIDCGGVDVFNSLLLHRYSQGARAVHAVAVLEGMDEDTVGLVVVVVMWCDDDDDDDDDYV